MPIKELREDKLTELNLSSKGLGPAEGIVIAKLVAVTAVLKKAVLSYNGIKDEGAAAIGESLKTNSTLEELVLIQCSIGAEGAKAIAAGLSAGTAVLTKLECVCAALERATLNARASLAHQRNLLDAAHPPVPFARLGTPAFARPRPVSGARARLSEHSSRRASKALAFLSAVAPDAIPPFQTLCQTPTRPLSRRSLAFLPRNPLAFSRHPPFQTPARLFCVWTAFVTPQNPMPTSAACNTTTSTSMPNAPSPTPSAVPLSSFSSSEPPPGWRSKHDRRLKVPHHRLRAYLPATPGALMWMAR